MHIGTGSSRQSEWMRERGPEKRMADRQTVALGKRRKVQRMCSMDVADRRAVASGEDENQHEENIMRDIHTLGIQGSQTASEEPPDKLWRTVRFEQDARNSVSLEYPASCGRQFRPVPVLAQSSGHVDEDVQISAVDALCEMD